MAKKIKDEQQWVGGVYSKSLHYKSLNDVLDILNKAKAATERGEWRELYLETEIEHDYGGDSTNIVLTGMRPETDVERNKRADEMVKREEYQRQQYEQLKKRFEPEHK